MPRGDHECHSMAAFMGQADGELGDTKGRSQLEGGTMKADVRLATVVAPHFDLLPAHIPNAGAQGFGDSFLCSPTRRQCLGAAGAVSSLRLGEDAFEKPLAMPRHGFLYAFYFDQVNTYSEH